MSNQAIHQKLDKILHHFAEMEKRLSRAEGRLARSNRITGAGAVIAQPPQGQRATKLWIRLIWKPFLALAVIAGFAGTYASLRYDVSITNFATLAPREAFQSRFLVKNEGPFSVYNVTYECESAKVTLPGGRRVTNKYRVPLPLPELPARGSYSVRCLNALVSENVTWGAVMEIRVTYSPKFFPWIRRVGGEVYILKYDKAGDAVWIPEGPLLTPPDTLEDVSANP